MISEQRNYLSRNESLVDKCTMGGNKSKIADSANVRDTLRRVDECVLPDDHDPLLDYLELLEGLFVEPETLADRSEQLYSLGGVKMLTKLIKKMIKDTVALRLIIGTIELNQRHQDIIMEFIQYGGLELLAKINIQHEKDPFLSVMVPKFLKAVLTVGARAAIKEIDHEGVQLRLCRNCQETIHRLENPLETKQFKVPTSSERANRILMFMENYPQRLDVQMQGIEALTVYARNPDAKGTLFETRLIELACAAVVAFKNEPKVLWRGCLLLSIVATFQSEAAVEICRFEVHKTVAEVFYEFEEECRVQQQILWLLASLLTFPRSRRTVNASQYCMDLFIFMDNRREKLLRIKATSQAEKYAPFTIVAPNEIRVLLRDSGGQVVEDAKPDAPPQKKFKKRKFDGAAKPRFGTVEQHFKEGEKGLLVTKEEEEKEAEAERERKEREAEMGVAA